MRNESNLSSVIHPTHWEVGMQAFWFPSNVTRAFTASSHRKLYIKSMTAQNRVQMKPQKSKEGKKDNIRPQREVRVATQDGRENQ